MKALLSLVLLATLLPAAQAQRYRNPDQYLRAFTNENRKISKKNFLYLAASLKGKDERRVQRYREMVLEQLKDSRKEVARIGTYDDYEILQREYMDGLALFIDAFENDFGIADSLTANRYRSYDDLKKYFDAVTKAEGEMLDAIYKMEKAEEHFAKMNYITITRDEEMERQYELLDEVTLYSRDMTLSLFRVEQSVRDFLKALNEETPDSLLHKVSDIRMAISTSEDEIAEYADFEGEDDLYYEVAGYLQDVQEEVEVNLGPIAEKLENEYLPEDEYQDAQDDLQDFVERHEDRLLDYFEARADLIEDYLPED